LGGYKREREVPLNLACGMEPMQKKINGIFLLDGGKDGARMVIQQRIRKIGEETLTPVQSNDIENNQRDSLVERHLCTWGNEMPRGGENHGVKTCSDTKFMLGYG
jgi:hypothetical protein